MTAHRLSICAVAAGLALLASPPSAQAQDAVPAPAPAEPIAPLPPLTDVAAPSTPAASSADAEAEALALALAQDGGGDASAAVADVDEFELNLYGFTDFTYTHVLNDFAFANPYPTFLVGSLNLYVGAELGNGWRSLTEFRLLYVPHGAIPTAQQFDPEPTRTDTTVPDPADLGRPLRWGGVEIERAWLEYSLHPLLTIQAGQWLTPYGIWNVDHGSPVIIGVRRPFVVGEALLPEHQTGVQLYGSFFAGTTEIGYNFGVTNGRGPVDAYMDLDKNKAVTARLWLSNDSAAGSVTLGGSLYRGRYTDRFSRFYISSANELGPEWISTARYEELGISGDLRWIWNDLSVQAEMIVRDVVYEDALRPEAFPIAGQPPGFTPDVRSTGWYVMGAYRLPWYNIMPFFGGEVYRPGQPPEAAAIWGGLNVRPIPRVVLKAQFTQSWFIDDVTELVGDEGLQALDLQAAWSF